MGLFFFCVLSKSIFLSEKTNVKIVAIETINIATYIIYLQSLCSFVDLVPGCVYVTLILSTFLAVLVQLLIVPVAVKFIHFADRL